MSISVRIFSFIHVYVDQLVGWEKPNTMDVQVDLPYLFVDKHVLAVTGKDIFLASAGMLPYTYCEVYAPLGINTNVCDFIFRSKFDFTCPF